MATSCMLCRPEHVTMAKDPSMFTLEEAGVDTHRLNIYLSAV